MPLSTFLAEHVAPWLSKAVSTSLPVGKTMLRGGLGGAAIGGAAGYVAAPQDKKMRGVVAGAGLGGIFGAMGGRSLATKLTGAGPDAAKLTNFGNAMKTWEGQSPKQFFGNVSKHIQENNWADPMHLQRFSSNEIPGTPHKPMGGILSKNPVATGFPENKGSMLLKDVGNFNETVRSVWKGGPKLQAKTVGGRMVEAVGLQAHGAGFYEHAGNVYRRSALGRVAAPLLTTGLGFGAMEAATATNKDGTPASVPKRIGKGALETAKWGLGMPVMGAKALMYDLPKQIINPEG